jgi:GNAT superfamily N-acetyltransferase
MKKIYSCRHVPNAVSLDKNDLHQVHKLWNMFNGTSLSEECFLEKILNQKYELILALAGDDIVGFVLCELISSPLRNSAYLEIWAIYVSDAHQRKGVGRILLEEVKNFAKSLGCSDIHVSSDSKPSVVDFYRSCGYHSYAVRMRKEIL